MTDRSAQLPASSPETELPLRAPDIRVNIDDRFFHINSLPDDVYGRIIRNNFGMVKHAWIDDFIRYHETHDMNAVLRRLKDGLDEVSREYIDRHEALICLSKYAPHVLVNRDFLWTDTDRMLFRKNREQVLKNEPPFMNSVPLGWSSSFTTMYGMYDLPEECLKKLNGKDLIDAGGYLGDTVSVLRVLFPDSVVHTFEPLQVNTEAIRARFQKDIDAGKVKLYKAGLGESEGSIDVMSGVAAGSEANFKTQKPDENCKDTVPVFTVDALAERESLNVGLIKADVESFEPEVLRGAMNVIKTQRPVLSIACYHTPEEFYETRDMLESLDLGYKFMMRRSNFFFPSCELVLVAYHD